MGKSEKRKSSDSSGSGESSASSESDARRKRRRKERKKEKKRKKEERKHRKKERRQRDSATKQQGTSLQSVYAGVSEPLPSVNVGMSEEEARPEDELQPKQRVLGAQRPEDAQAEYERSQQIFTVFDPSLGVERQVRASGEVVEQCISRSAAAQLQHDKARVVQPVLSGPQRETFTGRTKFPSQHPWFGHK